MNESIETINQRLIDYFGYFQGTEFPNYRVVWSDDQFEKRFCSHTNSGVELLQPDVRLVPKYSYIRAKYILEKACIVPLGTELIDKISMEVVWTFEDKNGNALPPVWKAIELLIYTINNAIANKSDYPKYKEPLFSPEQVKERIEVMEKDLFG